MSGESLHLLAAETALALSIRYLETPHRLGEARVFTSGRLVLWNGWRSLGEDDARRISRYMRARPNGIAEDVNLLYWGAQALDRGVRFRWSDANTTRDWTAGFERVDGKNLDRLIDELLDALEARRNPRTLPELVREGDVIHLRRRRTHFTVPASDLPSNTTEWPELHCTAGTSASIDRGRILSLARELDSSDRMRVQHHALLEEGLFREMQVGPQHRGFHDVVELPSGPTNLFVAPTGSGKSVFARLLALDHASRGIPVTLAVRDIKATLQEAHLLEEAAAAVGREARITPLNSARGSFKTASEMLAHPPGHDPTGEWVLSRLGYFCQLAAYTDEEQPAPGDEPCNSLRQIRANGREQSIACPFMRGCPKFSAFREATRADIIVVNHKALLAGRSPIPIKVGGRTVPKLAILELVMRRSGLILIDEIDELQRAAIAEGTGDLQLSSSERLSPVHETLNDFEHRLASGELPFDARLDSVRRPLFFVRWLSEELTRGINRGDMGWPRRDRMRWSRSKDSWLSRRLFGDDPQAEQRFQALYESDEIAKDPPAEALRQAVLGWKDLQLDDTEDTVALRTSVIEVIERWPRRLDRRSDREQAARKQVVDGLILRALLERLEQALNHLRVYLALLDEYGVESAARLRDSLLGYRSWSPSPLGPLGRRATGFAFSPREDGRGTLSARALAGDPHGFIAGLGNEVALALSGVRRPVLGLSATARFRGAPTWDVQSDVLIAQPDAAEGVSVEPVLVNDVDDDGKPLRISGISAHRGRLTRAARLGALLWRQVLHQHLQSLSESAATRDRARVLLVTGSYPEAKAVASAIAQAMDGALEVKRRIRVLARTKDPAELVPTLVPREIESFGGMCADILVAPLSLVARGHNILQPNSGKSAIASIFVLVRPVPPADDVDRILAHLSHDAARRLSPSARPGEALTAERRRAEQQLRFLEQSAGPFGSLPEDLRHHVLCDVLVGMAQLAGRARRGGTDVRVFLTDAAFHDDQVGWARLLEHTFAIWRRDGSLDEMLRLHRPFLRALQRFAGMSQ